MFFRMSLPAAISQKFDARSNFKQPFLIRRAQTEAAGPGIGDNCLQVPAAENSMRLKGLAAKTAATRDKNSRAACSVIALPGFGPAGSIGIFMMQMRTVLAVDS